MIVMDGSMGNELLARRSDLVTGLWSAQYLIDAPELVKEIQRLGQKYDELNKVKMQNEKKLSLILYHSIIEDNNSFLSSSCFDW